MDHHKFLLLLIVSCFQISHGRLNEPRLDELLARTSTLQASERKIANIFRKTEDLQKSVVAMNSYLQSPETPGLSKGFKVTYVKMGPEGVVVSSPSLRDVYPSKTIACRWEIEAPPGYTITLMFTKFKLIYGTPFKRYFFNKFRALSRISEREVVGETVLGLEPRTIGFSSNQVVLEYEANRLFNGIGFVAHLSAECKESLLVKRDKQDLFSHPLYGFENYPVNVSCEWVLDGGGLELIFTLEALDLGTKTLVLNETDKALAEGLQESFCQNDYLEVYLYFYNLDNKLLGRVCGNEIPKEMTQLIAEKLIIKFHSDREKTSAGFHATYQHKPRTDS